MVDIARRVEDAYRDRSLNIPAYRTLHERLDIPIRDGQRVGGSHRLDYWLGEAELWRVMKVPAGGTWRRGR